MQTKTREMNVAHLLRKQLSDILYALDTKLMQLTDSELMQVDNFQSLDTPGITLKITINHKDLLDNDRT